MWHSASEREDSAPAPARWRHGTGSSVLLLCYFLFCFRYKCHLKFSWAIPRPPVVEIKAGVVSGFSYKTQISQSFDTGTQRVTEKALGKHPAGDCACFLIVLPVCCTACQGNMFSSTDIPGNNLQILLAASPEHCHTLCSAHPLCTYFSYVR